MEGCGPNAVEKGSGKEERIGIPDQKDSWSLFYTWKSTCLFDTVFGGRSEKDQSS